jgi:aminoglycoside phosphotransferase (APT) family kinase protein
MMKLSDLREHIPSLTKAEKISLIERGFSSDQKYFVYHSHSEQEPTHVLRTAPLKQHDRKRREFEVVSRVYEHGVKTSRPIEFGEIESLELCYMVLSFVPGEDAADVLPRLTPEEQYHIGWEAGKELKRIHELRAPAELNEWHVRRAAKHVRQLEVYRQSGYRLPEEKLILDYIDRNMELMKGRPNRLQHDDFHPSNLVVHDGRYSGTIDFNRYDWGDPYHEFLKIAYFSRHDSVPFSIGQVEGYFDGQIPLTFWKLYSLYNAMIMLPSISWTIQVVPEQLDSMLERIRTVLEDHNNFEGHIPAWFQPSE